MLVTFSCFLRFDHAFIIFIIFYVYFCRVLSATIHVINNKYIGLALNINY